MKMLLLLLIAALAFSVLAVVAPGQAHASTRWCVQAVSAAVAGLGAATIGLLAFFFPEGVLIAGVFVSEVALQRLSQAMSSWSALQGVVAAFVC
ncbi:MAG: hypothetical protein M3256_04245 [Actinomycetota bacterium]|nr:hypothetical protein [Actinomycetota bacterium]